MSFADLERTYDALAEAIDTAGEPQERVFLAKLALALAHEVGDMTAVQRCIAAALADLTPQQQARTDGGLST